MISLHRWCMFFCVTVPLLALVSSMVVSQEAAPLSGKDASIVKRGAQHESKRTLRSFLRNTVPLLITHPFLLEASRHERKTMLFHTSAREASRVLQEDFETNAESASESSISVSPGASAASPFSSGKNPVTSVSSTSFHEEHSPPPGSANLIHKLGSMFLIILVTLIGCIAPYLLDNIKTSNIWMMYINSFAAGNFLGLFFFHLLEEVTEISRSTSFGIPIKGHWFDLMYVFTFGGFLIVFFLEKIAAPALSLRSSKKNPFSHCAQCHITSHHDSFPSKVSLVVSPSARRSELNAADRLNTTHTWKDNKVSKDGKCASGISLGTLAKETTEDPDASISSTESSSTPESDFPSGPASFFTLSFVCFSLCFHSISEGMIIGLFPDALSIWIATFSVCGHKWAASFALAANYINKNTTRSLSIMFLSFFVLSSPLGVLMGIVASLQASLVFVAINSIGLGTIMYAATEMAFSQFQHFTTFKVEMLKMAFLMLGSTVVFLMTLVNMSTNSTHRHLKSN